MAFRIQSAQTEYYLISDGKESDGSIVATVPKNEYNPSITVRVLVHVLKPVDNSWVAGCYYRSPDWTSSCCRCRSKQEGS